MILEFYDQSTTRFTLESFGWYDSEMLEVGITAKTHWFQVSFGDHLIVGETEEWAAGLRKLHGDMAGSYVFRSMHGWLQITYAMGKKGELHVSIQLQHSPDYLNEVRLFLNLDQSYLPAMADQILEFGNP